MVQKDVFRLQVSGKKSHSVFRCTHSGNKDAHRSENTPVNNVEGVQVSQCTRHFSNVELGSGLRKGALFLKMEEKLQDKTPLSVVSDMVTTLTERRGLLREAVRCSLTSRSDTHLSPVDEVQDEVQLVCRLEGVMEPHQERVFHVLQQHVALCHDVFLLKRRKEQHRWTRIHSRPKAEMKT